MAPQVGAVCESLKTYLYVVTFIYQLVTLHLLTACCLCVMLPFRNAFFSWRMFWSQSDVPSQRVEISRFSKPPLDSNAFLDPHFI